MRVRRWYQRECARYCASHPHAGIFMDKRLGKVISSFDWALSHRRRNVLIIAPLSATTGWLDDAEIEAVRAVLLHGGNQEARQEQLADAIERRDAEAPNEPIFTIINPEGIYLPAGRKIPCTACNGHPIQCPVCSGTGRVRRGEPIPTALVQMPFDAVIWDETVSLKNPKAQINTVAHDVFASYTHRLGLSGEYAPEGIQDSFEQMRWIFGRFMGFRNYWKWRHHYFSNAGYDWFLKPGARQDIKDAIHQRCYVLHRKDAGITEVRAFERRWCELPQKVRKAYDDAEKYFELPYADNDAKVETKYGLVSKTWLSQVAGGYPPGYSVLHSPHKTNVIFELYETYKYEPVVILFRFNSELLAVEAALQRRKIVCTHIIGATPPAERRKRMHAFQAGKIWAILLQIKVAKYGLTLSRSSTMFRFSLSDPWDDISQSMDRIVDVGKTDPLAYIDVVAKDTVDEDRLNALGDKGVDSRYYMRKFEENFAQRRRLKEMQHVR
jgi:hypothetical protein